MRKIVSRHEFSFNLKILPQLLHNLATMLIHAQLHSLAHSPFSVVSSHTYIMWAHILFHQTAGNVHVAQHADFATKFSYPVTKLRLDSFFVSNPEVIINFRLVKAGSRR